MEKIKNYVIEYEEQAHPIFGVIMFIIGGLLIPVIINNFYILDNPELMSVLGILLTIVFCGILLVTGVQELNNWSKKEEGEIIKNKTYITAKKILSIKEIINPEQSRRKPIKYKEIKFG